MFISHISVLEANMMAVNSENHCIQPQGSKLCPLPSTTNCFWKNIQMPFFRCVYYNEFSRKWYCLQRGTLMQVNFPNNNKSDLSHFYVIFGIVGGKQKFNQSRRVRLLVYAGHWLHKLTLLAGFWWMLIKISERILVCFSRISILFHQWALKSYIFTSGVATNEN